MLGYEIDGVCVINICDLFDELIGPDHYSMNVSYKEESEILRKWLDDNNAHYYAEEKHCFSEWTAVHEAKDQGKSIVVLDNLS